MIRKGTRKLVCILTLGITSLMLAVPTVAVPIMEVPEITAEGAILVEPKTNTVLYEKNAHKALYPASITKILTALIVSEELEDNTIITKSQACTKYVPWDSSQIGLNVGDRYTKEEGLYGLLLGSDNFIAYDLACATAGDISSFAQKMNEKAISLGAYESQFVNPHGYHDPNHYTTPYDMAQIARGAFSDPTVSKIAGTAKHKFVVHNTGVSFPIINSSRLLKHETPYYNPNVVACKTGFHDDARQTLVAKAVYDNIELIAVVMKDSTPTQYEDINKLFEFGKQNFSLKEVNGAYILDNKSISIDTQKCVDYFNEKGWISKGVNFQDPIKGEELTNLLKKIGNNHPEADVEEIIGLLGVEADEVVTKNQLATIIMFLEDRWHQGDNSVDTAILNEKDLFYKVDEICLEDAIDILYEVGL